MPRLAIVGASVRAAAMSAIRAGYEVVAADLFADEDLRRICPTSQIADYPSGFAAWLADQKVDGWIYTGALENHPDLVDEMSRLRPLLGNPGSVLRQVRSPRRLEEVTAQSACRFPEIRTTAEGLPRDGTWLCKTYQGSSGSGVWALDSEASANSAREQNAVFQRRIEGEPLAAVYVGGKSSAQLLGLTRQLVGTKWTGAAPFQYCGSISYPLPLDGEGLLLNSLHGLGNAFADAFQLRGLFGVDLILSGDALFVLEINPRYTASVEVVERAAGIHALGGWGRVPVLRNEPPASSFTNGRLFHGKAILFAKHDAVVSSEFSAWAMKHAGDRLADVPKAGSQIAKGRPVVTLFAAGKNSQTTSAALQEFLAEVEARLD